MLLRKTIISTFCLLISIFVHAQPGGSVTNAQDYNKAVDLLRQKQYQMAIDLYSKVIERNPVFFEAFTDRARCYQAVNRDEEALNDFKSAIQKNANYYPAWIYRGVFYTERKDFFKAIDDFSKAMKLKPQLTEPLLKRAEVYIQLQRWDDAVADITKALEINKTDANAFFLRGGIYEVKKQKKEAFADYTSAIKNKPNYAEAFYKRGLINASFGDYTKSLSDFNQALSLNNVYEEVLRARADLYYYNKKYNEAYAEITRVIEAFKANESELYYKRGVCLSAIGKCPDAIKDFNKAANISRENDSAYVQIGNCYMRMDKKSQQAMTYYRRAMQANPQNAEAYLGRAKVYLDMKRPQLALQDLDESLKFGKLAEAYYLRGALRDQNNDKKGACEDLKMAAQLGYTEAQRRVAEYCPEM